MSHLQDFSGTGWARPAAQQPYTQQPQQAQQYYSHQPQQAQQTQYGYQGYGGGGAQAPYNQAPQSHTNYTGGPSLYPTQHMGGSAGGGAGAGAAAGGAAAGVGSAAGVSSHGQHGGQAAGFFPSPMPVLASSSSLYPTGAGGATPGYPSSASASPAVVATTSLYPQQPAQGQTQQPHQQQATGGQRPPQAPYTQQQYVMPALQQAPPASHAPQAQQPASHAAATAAPAPQAQAQQPQQMAYPVEQHGVGTAVSDEPERVRLERMLEALRRRTDELESKERYYLDKIAHADAQLRRAGADGGAGRRSDDTDMLKGEIQRLTNVIAAMSRDLVNKNKELESMMGSYTNERSSWVLQNAGRSLNSDESAAYDSTGMMQTIEELKRQLEVQKFQMDKMAKEKTEMLKELAWLRNQLQYYQDRDAVTGEEAYLQDQSGPLQIMAPGTAGYSEGMYAALSVAAPGAEGADGGGDGRPSTCLDAGAATTFAVASGSLVHDGTGTYYARQQYDAKTLLAQEEERRAQVRAHATGGVARAGPPSAATGDVTTQYQRYQQQSQEQQRRDQELYARQEQEQLAYHQQQLAQQAQQPHRAGFGHVATGSFAGERPPVGALSKPRVTAASASRRECDTDAVEDLNGVEEHKSGEIVSFDAPGPSATLTQDPATVASFDVTPRGVESVASHHAAVSAPSTGPSASAGDKDPFRLVHGKSQAIIEKMPASTLDAILRELGEEVMRPRSKAAARIVELMGGSSL